MEVSIKFKVRPFAVPETVQLFGDNLLNVPDYPTPSAPYAVVSDEFTGMHSLSNVSLKMLSSEELASLCWEFKNEVFKKAGKAQPPECVNTVEKIPQELIDDLMTVKTALLISGHIGLADVLLKRVK